MVRPIRPQDPLAEAGGRQPARMMAGRKREEDGVSVTDGPGDADGRRSNVRRRRERLAVLGGLVVTALAIAGIILLLADKDTEPAATRTPATTAPDASPDTGESPPATPADLAAAEAQERYRAFIQVKDQVAQGQYADPRPYETVAINPERAQLILEARQFAGARVTGATRIASLDVESVVLPASTEEYPEVRLIACLDVSGVRALGPDGVSLVSPDRLDRILSRVLLQRFEPGDFAEAPERSGWFVAEVDQRGESC
jgi:hypothetical protein